MSDEYAGVPPSKGKWTPKEVIGHLIDSASNNHGRFVRAAISDEMVFPGYEQDQWVRTQRYNECPWMDLVSLWLGYNNHIARVIERVAPTGCRYRGCFITSMRSRGARFRVMSRSHSNISFGIILRT